MSGEDSTRTESAERPFSGSFEQIVRRLEKQPALLAALGGGILVLSVGGIAGGLAADQIALLVGGIVVLVLAGLVAWLLASRSRSGVFAPRFKGTTEGRRVGSVYGARVSEFRPRFRGDTTAEDIGVYDNRAESARSKASDDPRE